MSVLVCNNAHLCIIREAVRKEFSSYLALISCIAAKRLGHFLKIL